MSYESLVNAIEGVLDNNSTNSASWSDWHDAPDIIRAYCQDWNEAQIVADFSDEEIAILDRAIKSNGATAWEDMRKYQEKVWGANFIGQGSLLSQLQAYDPRYADACCLTGADRPAVCCGEQS